MQLLLSVLRFKQKVIKRSIPARNYDMSDVIVHATRQSRVLIPTVFVMQIHTRLRRETRNVLEGNIETILSKDIPMHLGIRNPLFSQTQQA